MRPLAALVTIATRSNVRRISTSTGEATGASTPTPTSKSMLQIPAWGLVGLGSAAAGFFGKVLHDDNLETRRELQAARRELREDIKSLENKVDAGFEKVNQAILSSRPVPK